MRAWPLVLFASASLSCGLVISTDDYDATERTYAVRGSVEGLGSDDVTLLLNGGSAIGVREGPFAFPAVLRDGAPFAVTTRQQPSAHSCTLERAAGAIQGKDIDDVVVRCASTDASLDALALSNSVLTPAFDPHVHDYDVDLKVPSTIFDVPPLSVTLSARPHDPGASLTLGGTTSVGAASAPFVLKQGTTALDVIVRAVNPSSPSVRYRINVHGYASDYLKPSPPHEDAGFGGTIAFDGDTLAVAAPFDGTQKLNAGAVYVFTRKNAQWSETAIILPPTPNDNLIFGYALALRGDTLVIGARGERGKSAGVNGDPTPDPTCVGDPPPNGCFSYAGAAYVYVRDAAGKWSQQAYLKSSATQRDGNFGQALALDGDTLVVGAPGEGNGPGQIDSGSVHVFTRSAGTWSPQSPPLKSPNIVEGGEFGSSVALDGDALVVGAPFEQRGAGHVYAFTRGPSGWSVTQSITTGDAFALPLALSKGTLAIGADEDASAATGIGGDETDTKAVDSGAVLIFTKSNSVWTKQAYIKASNSRAGFRFGGALALLGDALAVTAVNESSGATGVGGDQSSTSIAAAGAVYYFTRTGTTWAQKRYIKASNPQPGAWFGSSVALSADVLVVGAQEESSKASGVNGKPQDDTSKTSAGAGYAF